MYPCKETKTKPFPYPSQSLGTTVYNGRKNLHIYIYRLEVQGVWGYSPRIISPCAEPYSELELDPQISSPLLRRMSCPWLWPHSTVPQSTPLCARWDLGGFFWLMFFFVGGGGFGVKFGEVVIFVVGPVVWEVYHHI